MGLDHRPEFRRKLADFARETIGDGSSLAGAEFCKQARQGAGAGEQTRQRKTNDAKASERGAAARKLNAAREAAAVGVSKWKPIGDGNGVHKKETRYFGGILRGELPDDQSTEGMPHQQPGRGHLCIVQQIVQLLHNVVQRARRAGRLAPA